MDAACQQCHAPLPEGFAEGLCPTCLLRLGRDATSAYLHHEHRVPSAAELDGRLPGLEFLELIGRGGMGAVYRARQVDLERDVAVKVLPEELSGNPTFEERFRREAKALARLDHPNIVNVYDSGVSDGLCYIVMELVRGTTLRDAMRAGAIDPEGALRIIPKICAALEYAHDHGVVHRDIKPENILLAHGGGVKVADFGLAQLTGGDGRETMLTATGSQLGTLRYMAPEQFAGARTDHRVDIYALGVVLYELLTGEVPMGDFPLPSQTKGTDPRIDRIIRRTLQREPDDRYRTVRQLEADLARVTSSHTPGTRTRSAHWNAQPGREWKSPARLFGVPVIHVAYGFDPKTGDKLVARGIIAVGDVAIGGIASGGLSVGLISFGGVALGLNAIGGLAIGLQLAFGGAAVGGIAMGGAAVGLVALGGGALGLIAAGGGVLGIIAGGGNRPMVPPAETASEWVKTLYEFVASPVAPTLFDLALLIGFSGPVALILALAIFGYWQHSASGRRQEPMPSFVRGHLAMMAVGFILGLIGIVPGLVAVHKLHAKNFASVRVLGSPPAVAPLEAATDRPFGSTLPDDKEWQPAAEQRQVLRRLDSAA